MVGSVSDFRGKVVQRGAWRASSPCVLDGGSEGRVSFPHGFEPEHLFVGLKVLLLKLEEQREVIRSRGTKVSYLGIREHSRPAVGCHSSVNSCLYVSLSFLIVVKSPRWTIVTKVVKVAEGESTPELRHYVFRPFLF